MFGSISKAHKAYADKNYGIALPIYEKAVASKASDPLVYERLAGIYHNHGKYHEAIILLDQMAKLEGQASGAYFRSGMKLFSTFQFELAIEYFDRSLGNKPKNEGVVRFAKCRCLQLLGKLSNESSELSKLREVDSALYDEMVDIMQGKHNTFCYRL